MGNSHCVPQAPRRLRASFSRKPSLKGNREDGARKLVGLFGTEASPDGDTTDDKIFRFIPGTSIPSLESQQENLEQPFLSVFKAGQRRAPVRSLGTVVHYTKVQLRFQHSQDISDCYLELFPSHLYFQAHGSEGLTFQGLLPLMELSVCPLEGSREHAFQITGPLPAPLLVLCPSQAELDRWLYHLEKQIALVGGVPRRHPAPPQGPPENELPWTLQHRLTPLRTASGLQVVGTAICASRVKLQHLPSQEQWDRLLVLYPTSLAIFSEEADGLCFKGELPLSAIHINLNETEKQIRSFLIEGRLINTIRVVCASYEDYGHWLLCLQSACREDRTSSLPGPESFPGLRAPPQAVGSGRGSLSSGGRTSWDSGCPAPTSSHTSHSTPESTGGYPARPAPEQASPGCPSVGGHKAKLRRAGSNRSPRSKAQGEGPGPATPLHLDLTKLRLEDGPEAPDHSLETPHSPLYADPYTPPATSHRRVTDIQDLDKFLSAMQSSVGPEPSSPFPFGPVSVPVSDPSSGFSGPHLLSEKGVPQARASQRHRGSIKGRGSRPPGSPQLVSPAREVAPEPPPPPPDGRPPRSSNSVWDKALSPSHQRWPRGAAEAEGGLVQWI
ncbi:pleckstrin homology domain-containing family N member 1 isoform X2 [Neophocaena asiaeorientalis asiaeorientalis]|uniref:Pleckstrin homology domain-containing family N member 1 isoform X2 n=1 Tax=Neophocaena asiaeorientalis asiaeorientalis TaxID=1706337 RepID=A0A341CP19_NEOAA|nr:pleckstrin homology domain-containing family N member 1 isoform X2 [Neophocaena asiaeorientalis asiaeorientalis]XP_032483954.1 pleckstrin homology domain-containing family N member 1 isoform X5 [Phocoena sinus]